MNILRTSFLISSSSWSWGNGIDWRVSPWIVSAREGFSVFFPSTTSKYSGSSFAYWISLMIRQAQMALCASRESWANLWQRLRLRWLIMIVINLQIFNRLDWPTDQLFYLINIIWFKSIYRYALFRRSSSAQTNNKSSKVPISLAIDQTLYLPKKQRATSRVRVYHRHRKQRIYDKLR